METRDMFRLFINSNGLIYELRKVEVPKDTRSGDYLLVDQDCLALYLHTHTLASACISLAARIAEHRIAVTLPACGNVFNFIQA